MADPLEWLYEHIEAQDSPTTLGRLRAVADEIERLRAEAALSLGEARRAARRIGAARREIELLRAEVGVLMGGLELAWGIICSARAWDPAHHDEWEAAKVRFRTDHWHPALLRNVLPEQGDDQQALALAVWSARVDGEPDDLTTETIVEAIREQRGPLPEQGDDR